ncbi:MAG: YicC/YloC family endoribonuclease, partial [Pseudomonadota bacterium]
CLLRYDGDNITSTTINEENLAELRALMDAVHRVVPDALRPSTLDLVRWPGVLDQASIDEARLFEQANDLFDEALTGLIEMRRREGHEMHQAIAGLLSNLVEEVTHIAANVQAISQHQSQRLRDRLAEAAVDADPGRLEQELVFLLQKSDIQEELDRLNAHIEEVRAALSSSEPSGRRLDFLMQELNREVNTIASKSASIDTSNHTVQMKVLIEQMREQIQNIE